ncbi:AraC family transcriptional regulator [Paenibacillus puerhi]|uniref:AraC family transcriptional regulator n=1 Tax=Paenibacillus puerhi TaxID=2692622 RepID=UPI00135C789E|nr:AraC family transcriptional regulator [Paenibacillus puerhi]
MVLPLDSNNNPLSRRLAGKGDAKHAIDEWTNQTLSAFPVHCSFRTTSLYQRSFHSHSGYELYVCVQGSGTYIAGERIHTLGPGTLTVVSPMALHRSRPELDTPFHRFIVAVEKSYLEGLCEGDASITSWIGQWLPGQDSDSLHAQLNARQLLALQGTLSELEREVQEQQPGFELAAKGLLLQLFMQLGRYRTDPGPLQPGAGERKRYVEGILGYMKEHYREPLRTEDLCAHFHLSRSYLYKIFKQDTGVSVHEFLVAYRINKAKEMLQSSELPITEVAALAGFHDMSHFCHTFKRYTEMTPSGYRSLRLRLGPDAPG